MTIDNEQEKELILKGLYRDRDELSGKLSEIEKLIKKLKSKPLSLPPSAPIGDTENVQIVEAKQAIVFPYKSELKFQVIAIFDMIGTACKLKEIQSKYLELTGSTYNTRETVRTLNKHKIIKMLRPKDGDRGLYWVKTDWLENNNTELKNEHKFFGYDLLYNKENTEFV